MIEVSVCICTRKRQEGLKKLLDSMANLLIPPETNLRIVIVENDSENFSETMIKEFASRSKIKISYFLEKRQGIVYARNRSVVEAGDCDFCCFTDDDQVVSPEWLAELLKCQKEFNADGVTGPTKPYFSKKVPAYIEKFYTQVTYDYGTVVKAAFTGCLLLRTEYLNRLNGPFDVRLNFSGGEDSFMTKKISDLGGVIRYNPDAIAFETISEDRATIKFIIKRSFRISNTRLLLNSIDGKKENIIKALPRLVMRFCHGILIILPCLVFCKANKLDGLIKIVKTIGGFSFFFGKKSQFYKKS